MPATEDHSRWCPEQCYHQRSRSFRTLGRFLCRNLQELKRTHCTMMDNTLCDVNGATIDVDYIRATPSEDSAIVEFAEFYQAAPWSGSRTLDNNDEGSMMVTLVNDTAFVNWAKSEIIPAYDRGPMDKPACDLECICYNAAACGMVKCPIGLAGNAVCVGCGTVAGGCVVVEVVSWLFDF